MSHDQLEITEHVDESTGDSVTKISCPFQAAGVRNKNGRIYPPSIWERIVDSKSGIQELIRNRGFHGTLGHPEKGVTPDGSVSHTVTQLYMKPNGVVMGVAEVNNTDDGKKIQEYRRQKYMFGISSRGVGSVSSDGTVQEDYELRAFDIVLNPSTPGATVKPVVKSGKDESVEEVSKSQPDPVPTTVVENREEKKPPTAVVPESTGSGKPQEVPSVMDMINQYKLLEADAKTLLALTQEDCGSKREVTKAQSDILDLTGKLGELDESVAQQRDSLVKRLVTKREKMDEWTLGGAALAKSDSADATSASGNDELAEAKKQIDELTTKVAEAEKSEKAATDLAEAIKKKNDELSEQVKAVTEERDLAEGYLEAALDVIAAVTAVVEAADIDGAVGEAIAQEPRLEQFKGLLEKCENRDELAKAVTQLSEAFTGKTDKNEKASLPPKGSKATTPKNIGESKIAGKGESGADTEKSTIVGEGLSLLKKMHEHSKQLEEARDRRHPTIGSKNSGG